VAKDYEGDYQFGAACQVGKNYERLPELALTSEFKVIAEAFSSSVQRVISMHCLPIELA
jgi:hypothetical protein